MDHDEWLADSLFLGGLRTVVHICDFFFQIKGFFVFGLMEQVHAVLIAVGSLVALICVIPLGCLRFPDYRVVPHLPLKNVKCTHDAGLLEYEEDKAVMMILKLFTMLPIDVLTLVQQYWSDSGPFRLLFVTRGDRLVWLEILLKEQTAISYSVLRKCRFSCVEVETDAQTLGYDVQWTMRDELTAVFLNPDMVQTKIIDQTV
jgi:hypothetical protein